MNTRLALIIPERWPDQPDCEWALLDRDGRIVEHGRSAPSHWPNAGEHVALIDGADCLLAALRVPPSKRRDRLPLIRYALEARLARDIDHEHVTITSERADEEQPGGRRLLAVVIEHARLRQICAQFEALRRPLGRAVALVDCLPATTTCWQAIDAGTGSLSLRAGPDGAITVDMPPHTPSTTAAPARGDSLACALTLATMAEPAQQPAELVFTTATPLTDAEMTLLSRQCAMEISQCSLDGLWGRSLLAANLLHGPFAPAASAGTGIWGALRLPAALAGAATLIAGIALAVGIAVDRNTVAELEGRERAIFADALPATPAIAPQLQLRRALDEARRDHGLLSAGDLLALLQALIEANGSLPLQMAYRTPRLEAELASPLPATAPLAHRGLSARLEGHRIHLQPQP